MLAQQAWLGTDHFPNPLARIFKEDCKMTPNKKIERSKQCNYKRMVQEEELINQYEKKRTDRKDSKEDMERQKIKKPRVVLYTS